jgi:putrescine aminotransferase
MFEPLVGRLARALAEIAPGDCSISFFANSGTEAVEGALKLARAATKRTRIVATANAYHGKTMGALAASGRDAYKTPFGPLVPDVVHVPYGDVDALAAALHDAAAFIVEPVQGEGGVVVPPLGYLRAARELCDADGALLIADEVQTGLGRCGYTFACERDGVVPDVLVLAKGLSAGARSRAPPRSRRWTCFATTISSRARERSANGYSRARARSRPNTRASFVRRVASGCSSASSCGTKATEARSFPRC